MFCVLFSEIMPKATDKKSTVFKVVIKNDPLDGLDPLTINQLDPLTRMAADLDNFPVLGARPLRDTFEPWSVKKNAILHRFTTQEKLSITTSVFATDHGTVHAGLLLRFEKSKRNELQ